MILASSERRRRRRNLFGRPANGWNRSCGAAAWNRALNSPKKTRFPTNVFPYFFCFDQKKKLFLFFLPNTGESPSDLGIKAENSLLPPSPPPISNPWPFLWLIGGGRFGPFYYDVAEKIKFHYIYFFVFFIREGGCTVVVGASYLEVNYCREMVAVGSFRPRATCLKKKKKMVQHRKMIWK